MQVDALSVELRPRSMAEAADLGVRIVQVHARSVWRSALPAWALVFALALSLLPVAPWLPFLLIAWCKPWIDRSLLFALSRAVFGQSTGFADLWRARSTVWWRGLAATLTIARISPWRSFTSPIGQLEGQHGKARRARRRVLLNGQHSNALALGFVFSFVEIGLAVGLLSIVAWFSPPEQHQHAIAWLAGNSTGAVAVMVLAYGAVVAFVEPFFVAGGFAMYLNRRVQLEAWDVEQEFRRAFS